MFVQGERGPIEEGGRSCKSRIRIASVCKPAADVNSAGITGHVQCWTGCRHERRCVPMQFQHDAHWLHHWKLLCPFCISEGFHLENNVIIFTILN